VAFVSDLVFGVHLELVGEEGGDFAVSEIMFFDDVEQGG